MAAPGLLGRTADLDRIGTIVRSVTDGDWPAAVTLTGEAGIGKSTLWTAVVATLGAGPARVLAARASEAEAGFGSVVLTDLLADVASPLLPGLPGPQARALAAALLLEPPGPDRSMGEAVDPRSLGTAVLGILRALTTERPLFLAVDDVHWTDAASVAALTFALRRLVGERRPIGLVTTARALGDDPLATTFGADHAAHALGPVSLGVLHRLLVERLGLALTRQQLVRLEQASRGNPLLALEIGRELSRLDRWPLPGEPLPIPADARELLDDRIARRSDLDREVLFVTAATNESSAAGIAAALDRPRDDVRAAIDQLSSPADGLLSPAAGDGPWRFTHPLAAAAALVAVPADRRRALHARLAEQATTDEDRGRHAALAVDGPDPIAADRLDAAARSARRRGASLLAAEWAEVAADLTPASPASTLGARRRVRAARWLGDAGAFERAHRLLDRAIADLPAGDDRAMALELAAQMAGWSTGGAASVAIAQAALGDARDPVVRARVLLRLASEVDDLGVVEARRAASEAVELLTAADAETRDPDLLACAILQVANLRFAAGDGDDVPAVERAVALLASEPRLTEDGDERPESLRAHQDALIWLVQHDRLGEGARATERMLIRARERGHERPLPILEADLATILAWSGDMEGAAAHAQAGMDAATLSDHPQGRRGALSAIGLVALLRGDLGAAEAAATEGLAGVPGDAWIAVRHEVVLGSAALARGDASTATHRLGAVLDRLVAEGRGESLDERFAGDLVEAAVAAGDLDRARSTADLLEGSAVRMPRPWIRVMAPRARALVHAAEGDLDAAAASIQAALAAHADLPMPFELARTKLIAGRIARRRKERRRAGEILDAARAGFAALGATAWVAITDGERARLGRRHQVGALEGLTETEDRVARLAAAGLTNREVGDAAFLTAKSVEGVLGRVYSKLGIRSRAELGAWLAAQDPAPAGHRTGDPPFRDGAGAT